jgi:hypothetical protein
MKDKKAQRIIIISALMILMTGIIYAQSTNDILNLLISNKTISQQQADSIRADYAIRQQSPLPDKRLQIDFEFRPRTEYRNGYQQLRNDTTVGAFFTNQRSRINLNYTYNNRFILQFSVQDLRVWGQQDPRSTSATLQVFEAWAEPFISDKFSVRVGRQRLMYDNQRLFAENDWRLSAAVHDAINFRYSSSKISTDLALALNQTSERYFGTDYSPKDFTNYKFLAINYLKYTPGKLFTLTILNSSDGYQAKTNPEKIYIRYTLGGRIEVTKGNLYGTVAAYFQGGKNSSGKELSAWYIQPEARLTTSQGLIVRLGTEIFSGTNNLVGSSKDNSFVPLYGVAHRFNGSMDLITKFPADVAGAGLVNPYLFFIQPLFTRFELRSDVHTFHLQRNYFLSDVKIDRYLGMENDWLISFKPNQVTKVDLGFSYMIPTKSLEVIKGSGNSSHNLSWAYLSLTFRPVLFSTKFK